MRVRAKQGCHPSLTSEKEYDVIGLSHDSFRILNDHLQPYLYSRDDFEIVDHTIPRDWVWIRGDAEEFYANPPELSGSGFYEDYFDGNAAATVQLRDYLIKKGMIGSEGQQLT
jgi:hypothetical protein